MEDSYQKLNRKLAEWVFDKVEFICGPNEEYPRGIIYGFKDGKHLTCELFTMSETACFKWFVPKLYGYCLTINNIRDGWACQLFGTIYPIEDARRRIDTQAETPALAFCLAVEKLIDSEANNAKR